jgi:hypothetical protein
MVDIFEHIEQMPLRHPLFQQRLQGFKFFGDRLGFKALEVRLAVFVNRQFGVSWERGIDTLGHCPQPRLEMAHQGFGA